MWDRDWETKGAFGRLSERVTKQYIEEYKLPKDLYMDAKKVRSMLREGKKDKFSPEEKDLLLDLGLTGSQYRTAVQNGVTIKVPAEKVTKLVDRGWWGKVKETIGKPKTNKILKTEKIGEVTQAPRGLLVEGEPIATQESALIWSSNAVEPIATLLYPPVVVPVPIAL